MCVWVCVYVSVGVYVSVCLCMEVCIGEHMRVLACVLGLCLNCVAFN